MPVRMTPDQRAMHRFSDAVRRLAQMSGKNFEPAIRHELSAVLNAAVRNTKKATVKSIRENSRKQHGITMFESYRGPQSYTGKTYSEKERQRLIKRANERRGKSTSGGLIYYLPASREPKKYPDWIWKQIENKRSKQLKDRLGARGLAAKMWLHISDQLRLNVQAPAYVRAAKNAKKGDMAQLVSVSESGTGATYSIGFVNALTKTNPHARAGLAFRKALNARANYFSQSMKLAAKGVISSVFDRYPNLGRFS